MSGGKGRKDLFVYLFGKEMTNGMHKSIFYLSCEKYIENYCKSMIVKMCILFDLAILKEIIEVCKDISIVGFITALLSTENYLKNHPEYPLIYDHGEFIE